MLPAETLKRHHFNRLSVSHFGRDSRERNRYNHLSKAGADLVPFGCGAGGRVNGHSIMTERDLNKYHQEIAAGNKPIAMMTKPHPQHDLRYGIGGGFDLGYLDLNTLDQLGDLSDRAKPLFDAWQENGLVQHDGRYLNLTEAGQFWNINMQQAVNRYLDLGDELLKRQELTIMNNTLEQIETISKQQPLSSLAQVGRQLGLTELETVQALPAKQAQLVDGANFDRLMAELADFGPTTTVIEVAGQILEYKGGFPEGSYGHGFYNLKGEHLRGHLNPREVYAIAFVRRPFMRMDTRAIWLFNAQGLCSFKIYLGRDDKRKLLTEQVTRFDELEQEFLAKAPLLPPEEATAELDTSVELNEEPETAPKLCPISGIQFKQDQPLQEQQKEQLKKGRCPMKRLFSKTNG
uniref:Heme utilization cystosolic carrier protein HutX n=1 Tax=Shewanella eurypsychrophilus TaxID=2593656 RepID=A0A7S9J201_9GAMM